MLPKGCYVPEFQVREPVRPEVVSIPVMIESPLPVVSRRRRAPVWVSAAVCLAALAAGGLLIRAKPGVPPKGSRPAAGSEPQVLYARGRYLLDRQSLDSLSKGRECFRRAIALEPNYAAAWAGLADSYDMMSQFGFLP